MKLKEALKKFNFLKRLGLPDKLLSVLANHLVTQLKGDAEELLTPLAKRVDPLTVLNEWSDIFKENAYKCNDELISLEVSNAAKFGPRSVAVPWSERIDQLRFSYNSQAVNRPTDFHMEKGHGRLHPVSLDEAVSKSKMSSSSGIPLLSKKAKALDFTLKHFNYLLERKDPCVLYTRTSEKKKTRIVWGYPFADSLLENRFIFLY